MTVSSGVWLWARNYALFFLWLSLSIEMVLGNIDVLMSPQPEIDLDHIHDKPAWGSAVGDAAMVGLLKRQEEFIAAKKDAIAAKQAGKEESEKTSDHEEQS